MDFLKSFNIYQKERFPLAVLVFTITAIALSSSAVTHSRLNIGLFVGAFLAGLFYMFHIRVIDEVRDNAHDTTYHTHRPIPRGAISLRELKIMDGIGVAGFLIIALLFGKLTFLLAIVSLAYTFLAGKEFFLGERIRSRFFIYNAVNIVQLVLLQFFVYSLFSHVWYKHDQVWIHLLFIFVNALLIEILRKVKIKPEESVGHDTYSWHIGFDRALLVSLLFVFMSYGTFLWLLFTSGFSPLAFSISAFFMIVCVLSFFGHSHSKNKKSENYLYGSTLLLYIALNVLIYFFV